jgi:antitoxin ParD1/3/4
MVFVGIIAPAEGGPHAPHQLDLAWRALHHLHRCRSEVGPLGSASEVVRAGPRLLQEHEAKVKALEAALIEGEEPGFAEPLDSGAFSKQMHAKHDARCGT